MGVTATLSELIEWTLPLGSCYSFRDNHIINPYIRTDSKEGTQNWCHVMESSSSSVVSRFKS